MRLPQLNELSTSRDMIDTFGGYNHNLRIGENEFYDMKNLSSSHYPLLAPRRQRGKVVNPKGTPVGVINKDGFCYVYVEETEKKLYFVKDGISYDVGDTTVGADVERKLISMGAYVIIMPDKLYFNTNVFENGDVTFGDKGSIEAMYTSTGGETVKFEICKADGEVYSIKYKGSDEPESPKNNDVWIDTSSTPHSLKIYSEAMGMWSSVATTYIKITAKGIGKDFKDFDGVRISDVEVATENDLNVPTVIYSKTNDSIVIVGMLNVKDEDEIIQDTPITVKRLMPEMDFIIESNNRLWGCRYGLNRDGEVVNELYCSKLGDFKNWECFMGASTDSYYVSLGTDGQFTGAISYLGQPLFFKENYIHTVYGRYPAEYQVQDTPCRGVQKGSEKSLVMINEALYYKSRTGICCYSGALPIEISSVLGEKVYSDAVACGYRNKYYISMKDTSNEKNVLFVVDTEKGMWHKEDEPYVKFFCPVGEEIYFIEVVRDKEGKEEYYLRTMFGTDGEKDKVPVKWMAESGIIGCSSPDKKYVSRLSVRLSMEIGAKVVFYIQYDSSKDWEYVCNITGNSLRTMTLPIRPKRCDHFKLKIEGEGNVKIFSIAKIMEQGSDI